MSTKKQTILAVIFWVAICLIISALSGWITNQHIDSWYPHVNKPAFNPPAWVFAPVWITLYVMIGISGGLLWCKRNITPYPIIFFIIQLLLNFAWSFIFFGAHLIALAFLDIVLLWFSIGATILISYNTSKAASWLLVPYFFWVSFATILNASLWYLN
jgi:tryptophan-rich sensory protein